MQYVKVPNVVPVTNVQALTSRPNDFGFEVQRADGVKGLVGCCAFNDGLYPQINYVSAALEKGVTKQKEQRNMLRLAIRDYVVGIGGYEALYEIRSGSNRDTTKPSKPTPTKKKSVTANPSAEKPNLKSIGYTKVGRRWAVCNATGRFLDPSTGRALRLNQEATLFNLEEAKTAAAFVAELKKVPYGGEFALSTGFVR